MKPKRSKCASLMKIGLIAVSLAGCGGGGYDGGGAAYSNTGSNTGGSMGTTTGGNNGYSGGGTSMSGNGTLYVSLTDAPACGFDAVNITVQKIRVNRSSDANENDDGWIDIPLNPPQKINLLTLTNGALLQLGQVPLTPGHYSQLRLILDANVSTGLANSVVLTGAITEISLDTPGAVQSGIKLVDDFDVSVGQRADIVLDFDACKSIVTKGNGRFGLKPVVKVVPSFLNGIDGFVATSLLGKHVFVSAQQNGEIVTATAPNASTGEFFLAHLPPGNYDVVLTADNQATAVVSKVPVASSTSITLLSSNLMPLSLVPATTLPADISGMASLSPPSNSEVALVTAKQSFAIGPGFTVKYTNADAFTSAYILSNLSTANPQFAQYTANLPLTFMTTTGVLPGVGKYTVQASASGYQMKTISSVDISAGSQIGVNFTLMP